MPQTNAGLTIQDAEYIDNATVQALLATLGAGYVTKTALVISPVAVAANTTAEQSFVVPAGGFSVAAPDPIAVSKPTAQAGLGIVGFRRIDATHLGITFSNNTAAPITPTAAESYSCYWRGA